MTARATLFASIRQSLGVTGDEPARRAGSLPVTPSDCRMEAKSVSRAVIDSPCGNA